MSLPEAAARSAPATTRRRPPADAPRRTVVIHGRGAPLPPPSRRAARSVQQRTAARPDRIALWAVLLGLFLVVMAATTADAANRRAYVRAPLGERTLARGTAGSDVRTLQRILEVRATGVFGPITTRAVRHFQRDAGLEADGLVGPATTEALVDHRMAARMATWYGPGLFGNRTACGQRLTRTLRGVAHRRLPCGTAVTLYYAGRFTTARVVDRGPFRTHATFDLTAATARSLGLRTTSRVRAAY